ncbi:WXG100 family type VII secretion target [Actinacidiphila alni]|uniref:WXG100 family type VII secretion target n=1 Tax=Actinacidiphila alni TaxID=380248 RepID=A0A1I2J3G8_9ACTN|nr:WXG100 family type VII secretion target [Actinacidiphila alni]SFF47476.1 WXG100 family type VII secretion target [Actinacidiphila alni]
MADDGILIDHSVASSFAEEMVNFTSSIRGVITDLEGELAPIASQWLGADRDVYFSRVQPTWESEVGSLSTILSSHAETLANISDNYKQTVYQNAQGFEEIRF